MEFPNPIVVTVNFFFDKIGLYSFIVRVAFSVLNKKGGKCKQLQEQINLCYDIFRYTPLQLIDWSIKPGQIKREIQALLSMLSEKGIRVMLEIGTANGGTLFLFSRVADSNAKLISLNLPHKFGGYEKAKISFFTNFAREKQRIFLIRADSHSASSLLTVKSILKEQQLDFLFIDGDHTYEGVKKDFQMYSPLVCKGGLIAFYDIWRGPPAYAGEVSRFWNEIKHAYAHQEIIDNHNQKGFGIGVLYT